MKSDTLCMYRKIREWGGTKIVSIPSASAEQLGLEPGSTVKISIESEEKKQG
ncbi:MAG: AbrB/MazE/SpoVT family DNA-binding domain-containing protein [Candidatus Nanosalina sp.]